MGSSLTATLPLFAHAGDWSEYRYEWDLAQVRSMRVDDHLSSLRKQREYRSALAGLQVGRGKERMLCCGVRACQDKWLALNGSLAACSEVLCSFAAPRRHVCWRSCRRMRGSCRAATASSGQQACRRVL
jgi:hypothetical protein